MPLSVLFLSSILLSPTVATPLPSSARPYTGKALVPAYLRCEYRVDPLGIEETAPRLSWIVESGERGQRQTACRRLVASSEELLSKDRGDLWDTGKVASDETIGTPYQGQPLVSQQRCFWKVKVWDKDGRESPWSKPALWSMGLLQPSDWKADWIGYDKPHQPVVQGAPLSAAKWIWHAADAPGNVPKCRRLFYYTFNLPDDAKVRQAEVCASADDGMQFAINAHLRLTTEARNDSWRQPRKAQVAAELRPGRNELRVVVENAEPGYAGLIASLAITLEDGRIIQHSTGDSWKATDTIGDDWMTRRLDVSTWAAARVLGDYGVQPWGRLESAGTFLPPATYFRKEFRIDKP